MLLEANIDDMKGEIYSYVTPILFEQGAKDVFITNIQMKKNRPGVLLSVLIDEVLMESITELIFRETTTFGIRKRVFDRIALDRNFIEVATEFGNITIKEGLLNGDVIKAAPEYSDCARAARYYNVAIGRVYEAATYAYRIYCQEG